MRVNSSRSCPPSTGLAMAHVVGDKTGTTTSLKCSQGMPVNIMKEQVLLDVFDLKAG